MPDGQSPRLLTDAELIVLADRMQHGLKVRDRYATVFSHRPNNVLLLFRIVQIHFLAELSPCMVARVARLIPEDSGDRWCVAAM